MTAKKLDPHEWDFDSIPEPQLKACCVWEYARESTSIRVWVERWKNKGGLPPQSVNDEDYRLHQDAGYLLHHRIGYELEFWEGLPFPEPWQSIDITEREKWRAPEIQRRKFPPFQATGNFWVLSELYQKAREAHEEWRTKWGQAHKGEGLDNAALLERADSAAAVEQEKEPNPVSCWAMGGVQYFAAAQVNWGDYNNKEIVDAFRKWVEEKRPPTISEPSEAGHKPIDWRMKLGDLGILRLMYETKVGNMKIYQPEAWQRYGCRGERYWYTAHERALKKFHALLPFLPADELPTHAPTKAERNKLADCK